MSNLKLTIGDKPLSEVKHFWEVLWAIVVHPEADFFGKCYMFGLMVFCRAVAWTKGKDLQATLKALAMAVEEMKKEGAEHDF